MATRVLGDHWAEEDAIRVKFILDGHNLVVIIYNCLTGESKTATLVPWRFRQFVANTNIAIQQIGKPY